MKHIHLLLLALLALFAGSPFRAAAEESFRDRVVVIPVGEDSLTSKQSFGFMNRILKRAQEEQARAVVFDLNTPGGPPGRRWTPSCARRRKAPSGPSPAPW